MMLAMLVAGPAEILLLLVGGAVLVAGLAGLILLIVGLVKRRPGLWVTGLVILILGAVMVVGAGVAAALLVPKFTGRSEQAKVTAARADIANITVALDVFEVDCGRYPTAEEGLRALVDPPAGLAGWQGPYLKGGTPTDPWGNPYVYRSPGRHDPSGRDLYSMGPDGQDGGSDDIDNRSGR